MKNSHLFAALVVVTLTACGQEPAEAPAEQSAEAPAEQSAEAPATEAVDAAATATEAASAATGLPRTASPAGATVFFISPADGDTVTSPVAIEFGISGMGVVKAGEDQAESGHHHLIIDAGLPDLGLPIPADEHYVHFGDASTATDLTLEPGAHTLQLLLGDYLHIPHDPPVMSATITVVVE